MKLVLQRVSSASVLIHSPAYHQEIGAGLMILVGVEKGDTETEAAWLAEKSAVLRIFSDEAGKMNRSIQDIRGEVLAISQFTLAGDCRKGRRPGFDQAEEPEVARKLYEYFCQRLRVEHGLIVKTGVFAADMKVSLTNDGPVTFILERRPAAGLPERHLKE